MRASLILFLLALVALPSAAQPIEEARELAGALRVLVAVQTPRGPVPVRHCRRAPLVASGTVSAASARARRPTERDPWERCDGRLQVFAGYFFDAGRRHEVDPWLLAAMARQESGLNPFASGAIGEGGIAQLHPRGIGRRSRFVQDEGFRRACSREVGACQREVVELQAEHLRHWIDRCGGNVKAALGGYNRGRCGITAYTSNVLRHHRRLVRPTRSTRGSDA